MDSPVLSTMRCRLVPGRARRSARGEMLTASRERGVIGCREIDAQPPEDGCQDALGLTQRSVEDETERQGGVDGEIGRLELPAPPADASRCPRGDRVGREPAGDVASPHEGSVVLGPVWCNKAAEVGESAKQGRREWLLPQ